MWVGLDGRSIWSEDSMTMANRQWMSSTGDVIAEIMWNDAQPIEDIAKQCVFLSTEHGYVEQQYIECK